MWEGRETERERLQKSFKKEIYYIKVNKHYLHFIKKNEIGKSMENHFLMLKNACQTSILWSAKIYFKIKAK